MPGYAGFMPYMKSSNLFGKGYSPITRSALSNTNLGANRYHSNRFSTLLHIDPTKKAISHKYGSQTIQKFHPC